MNEPRVKNIIKNYAKGNLNQVYEYLTQPNMVVDPSTWCGRIKQLIEDKHYNTAKEIIELIAYKFIKLK